MDGVDGVIIVLVLIGWVVSSFAKAAKKKQQLEARREAQRTGSAQDTQEQEHPVFKDAPAHVPIHWEGSVEPLYDAPEPYPAFVEFVSQEDREYLIRPAEPTPYREALHTDGRAAAAVTVPGLNLEIDGDMLVRGVVFAEILNRRRIRRVS